MIPTDNGTINYRDELVRKLIHLCSLSIPVIYYFIPRSDAIIILSILTSVALLIDVPRYYSKTAERIFNKLFGFLLRQHETDKKKKNLTGATYVLISALLGVVILPKLLFITAFSILIISDSLAALVGRKFGKHRFLAKSLEGTLAFFISASIVVFFTPKVEWLAEEYVIGIVASAVGAVAENISFGIADDNLSIPLSIGLTMWALYLIFLPHINLTV
ncbi:MAG: SEC59/DGK1/VTE5 family protein [Ignavibacteriaceae bacterium]